MEQSSTSINKLRKAATMAVLCQTVNLVPQGKHWGFESLPSDNIYKLWSSRVVKWGGL